MERVNVLIEKTPERSHAPCEDTGEKIRKVRRYEK